MTVEMNFFDLIFQNYEGLCSAFPFGPSPQCRSTNAQLAESENICTAARLGLFRLCLLCSSCEDADKASLILHFNKQLEIEKNNL